MKHKPYLKNPLCDSSMSFEDCELAIVRQAADFNEKERLKHEIHSNKENIDHIFSILRDFLKRTRLVLYGGFAINAILPENAKFYDEELDIPDYDFYSPTPLHHAIELADIYHKKGFPDVEAKAGIHFGTYKVYVNFIPIADITLLDDVIFKNIQKQAIIQNGIYHSPPNFLRMNMYLELSRPLGQVDRWEKVLKRLTLLNHHYPITNEQPYDLVPSAPPSNINSLLLKKTSTRKSPKPKHSKNTLVSFHQKMDDPPDESLKIHNLVKDTFILMGCVFFGGYATSLYSQYLPAKQQIAFQDIPDFDVLHVNPTDVANTVVAVLNDSRMVSGEEVSLIKHSEIEGIIPECIEIKVGKKSIAFIYKPIACHNYNRIEIDGKQVNIATIDTMFNFYFAFYYSNQPYYYRDRILYMVHFLFEVEQQNRLEQKGLLQRFVLDCKGKQETMTDMHILKLQKYEELKGQPNSFEYLKWFLRYNPGVLATRKRIHGILADMRRQNTTVKNKFPKNKTMSAPPNNVKRSGVYFFPKQKAKRVRWTHRRVMPPPRKNMQKWIQQYLKK